MQNKNEILTKLQDLLDDFKKNYQKYQKELEANTETKLIEPLFELLGWTKKDFVKQEKAQRRGKTGHADYAFYVGSKIAFFLEVKRVGISLDREADKQVISYALSRRVPIAVSTNFEELKIFCVEQENAIKNKFRVFDDPEKYISEIDDLLLLSKESFEQGIILSKAEREGRLKRRVSINRVLLEDLMRIRSLIATDLEKQYPGKYHINEKDEIIQRIIDRLIFIRRCEDTGINIENITLKDAMILPDNKAYPTLKEIFKRYNDVYNSGLFAIARDNDCDKITINGEIIKKLTDYLYESKSREYVYNFDWIDADILGQVYEQYLGKILAQTKSGIAKLKNGQVHRKEQGIYYTPTYVVDYIVKSTVGEILKNKKIKTKDIRILDPACGSGSFLIKAYDYLYNKLSSSKESKQYRIDSQGKYSIKTEILKNNLYGVDLDNKAVEITKLNLLLKAAEKNRRLPEEIDSCIRHGNSLIEDGQVAGLNAFKWTGDFQEKSFDVVIGNPPWVRAKISCNSEELAFLKEKFNNYFTGELNLYKLFIVEALKKLKEGGYFSFIVPSSYLSDRDSKLLRKWILENFTICSIINFSEKGTKDMFDITQATTIITIKNKKPKNRYNVFVSNLIDDSKIFQEPSFYLNKISINSIKDFPDMQIPLIKDIRALNLAAKLSNNKKFSEIVETRDGEIHLTKYSSLIKDEKEIDYKILVRGNNISAYYIDVNTEKRMGGWINDSDIDKFKDVINKDRILIQQVSNMAQERRIKGAIVTKGIYAGNSCVSILSKNENYSLESILALLNSKLLNWYFKLFSSTNHVTGREIKNLPLNDKIELYISKLGNLATKILALKKDLHTLGDKKTLETAKIEEEIKRIEKQINNYIYKAYGLNKKEIDLVENY